MFNRKYVAARDIYKKPSCNSNVEISQHEDHFYARISMLFTAPGVSGEDVWFVVFPFSKLNKADQPKSPYKNLPQLNTKLLYWGKFEEAVVVHQSRVVGHVAILENEEGTFGVSWRTISVVSLGSMVRLFTFYAWYCDAQKKVQLNINAVAFHVI